jgi:hypothetical protein
MTRCKLALLSSCFFLLLGALARPAHAVKRISFQHGAGCQAKKTALGLLPFFSYVNAGVIVDGPTADFICPIPWSKEGLSTWEVLDKLDVHVDWLGLPSGPLPPPTPAWGCTLIYETTGGSLYMQALPVPYPIPSTMVAVAYAALWCTVPQSLGIEGYNVNMCFTSTTNPGACAPP